MSIECKVNDILEYEKNYYKVVKICTDCCLKGKYDEDNDEEMESLCIRTIQLTGNIEDNDNYYCNCCVAGNGEHFVWFTIDEENDEFCKDLKNVGINPIIEGELR